MTDDPRIKLVLKRYLKNEEAFEASVELIGVPSAVLRDALRYEHEDFLARPRQLDLEAQAILAARIGMNFDAVLFDYYLHPYIRQECAVDYHSDKTVRVRPPSEMGPPAAIPIPPGFHWVSVRPKDGQEHYVAWENEPKERP